MKKMFKSVMEKSLIVIAVILSVYASVFIFSHKKAYADINSYMNDKEYIRDTGIIIEDEALIDDEIANHSESTTYLYIYLISIAVITGVFVLIVHMAEKRNSK